MYKNVNYVIINIPLSLSFITLTRNRRIIKLMFKKVAAFKSDLGFKYNSSFKLSNNNNDIPNTKPTALARTPTRSQRTPRKGRQDAVPPRPPRERPAKGAERRDPCLDYLNSALAD